MIDKLIAINSMLLLAIIVILIVMQIVENSKRDNKLENEMEKFDNAIKRNENDI